MRQGVGTELGERVCGKRAQLRSVHHEVADDCVGVDAAVDRRRVDPGDGLVFILRRDEVPQTFEQGILFGWRAGRHRLPPVAEVEAKLACSAQQGLRRFPPDGPCPLDEA